MSRLFCNTNLVNSVNERRSAVPSRCALSVGLCGSASIAALDAALVCAMADEIGMIVNAKIKLDATRRRSEAEHTFMTNSFEWLKFNVPQSNSH